MSKGKKGKSLFSRAFDKAARLLPGQASTLTEEEDQELLRVIKLRKQRKEQALIKFRRYAEQKGINPEYVKSMFQQLWSAGRIS